MVKNELSEGKIGKILDSAYDKWLDGMLGMDSAYRMAENFSSKNDSVD